MFIYPIYNHNWGNISTIYIYNKTRIKRNILTIEQNNVGKWVGLRTYQHPGIVRNFRWQISTVTAWRWRYSGVWLHMWSLKTQQQENRILALLRITCQICRYVADFDWFWMHVVLRKELRENAVPTHSQRRMFRDQNCDITRLRNKLFVFANWQEFKGRE